MPASSHAIATAAFALVMFAANSLLCRMALGGGAMDAASYTTVRIASGALVLLLILKLKDGVVIGGDLRSAGYLFLYAMPFSYAYLGLSSGTGALILFGSVQLTMLAAALVAGERPQAMQWIGVVLAFGGLVYLVLPGLEAPSPLHALLMLIAGAAWGLYTLRGRGAGDPLARTAGNFLRAVPLVLVTSVVAWPVHHMEGRGVLLAVLSGAVASGLGYMAWYASLKHLSATRASVIQLLVPILAAIGGVVVLAEPFGARHTVATLLVLGGVWLTLRQREARA